jgi:hypothetical protein
MRDKRLIAVLLTAILLLGTLVPAIADDGRNRKNFDLEVKDHPWQDDTSTGGHKPPKTPLRFVIGPLTITVNVVIPFELKPSQTQLITAQNTTAQNKVEKGK